MNSYLKVAIALAGLASAYYLNFYKLEIFDTLQQTGESYKIFPWQTTGFEISQSTPKWLSLHLMTALVHVISSSMWLIFGSNAQNEKFVKVVWNNNDIIQSVSHLVFCFVVLLNFDKLGGLDKITASCVNIGIVTLLGFCMSYRKKLAYYLILLTPVIMEGVKYCKFVSK